MRLIIVRHGKAHTHAPNGTDFDRELKARGRRQAAFLAGRLAGLTPPVAVIRSSRAVRARQTAEGIAVHLGMPVDFDDRLLVDEPVSALLDLIGESRRVPSLVLVGHNPQLEHAVSMLTGRPPPVAGPLRTGEAVLLEVDPGEPLESGAELDRFRLDDEA